MCKAWEEASCAGQLWGPYPGHNCGYEGAVVIDPTVHTWLCGSLTPVGSCGIGVEELPLWVAEAAAPVRLQVGARWDGNGQEGLAGQVGGHLRAVVQHMGPAAMIWDSSREILQNHVKRYQDGGEEQGAYLQDLEEAHTPSPDQKLLKRHGWS